MQRMLKAFPHVPKIQPPFSGVEMDGRLRPGRETTRRRCTRLRDGEPATACEGTYRYRLYPLSNGEECRQRAGGRGCKGEGEWIGTTESNVTVFADFLPLPLGRGYGVARYSDFVVRRTLEDGLAPMIQQGEQNKIVVEDVRFCRRICRLVEQRRRAEGRGEIVQTTVVVGCGGKRGLRLLASTSHQRFLVRLT